MVLLAMMKCAWNISGNCVQGSLSGKTANLGRCPFGEGSLDCPMSCFGIGKTAAEKIASWNDVKAKGEAIAASGGVEIYRDDAKEVSAYVMSGQVAGEFPVTDGGPYDCTLAKKANANEQNVGGWVQSFWCDCAYGQFNSGSPGQRFVGRFCSHALALLLVSNQRARHEFMNDRTAGMESLGECAKCGSYDRLDTKSWLCAECLEEEGFKAVAALELSDDPDEIGKAASFVEDMPRKLKASLENDMKFHAVGGIAIASWNGLSTSYAIGKTATRRFTRREMDELDEEIEGKPLRNADRLRDWKD